MTAELGVINLPKIARQLRDIDFASPQRRHGNSDDTERGKQIILKLAGCDFTLQVMSGCADHTERDGNLFCSARHKGPRSLDQLEELGLQIQIESGDFFHKQSAQADERSVGQREVGFSNAFVLNSQRNLVERVAGRDRRAHFKEGGIGAGIPAMNKSREDFFPGSLLTHNQDGRAG